MGLEYETVAILSDETGIGVIRTFHSFQRVPRYKEPFHYRRSQEAKGAVPLPKFLA